MCSLYKGENLVAGVTKNTNTIVTGFNIFDVKWSDHILNDIQWLNADNFSWHSGDVYTTAYNKLVEEYATGSSVTEGSIIFKRTSNGFKIATASQEQAIMDKYNTDGIAWFYILDTTNKRFKLPRTKFGFEGLRTNVGNDIAESLPNITGGFNGRSAGIGGQTGAFALDSSNYGLNYTSAIGSVKMEGASFDASRSSSTYQDNAPVQERATQMYLYFYVGEYSRTAIEQTAGLNAEMFNKKVDIDNLKEVPVIIDTYVDGTSGYRIWSDGYCEQWGQIQTRGYGWESEIALAKTFANTNYQVLLSWTYETTQGDHGSTAAYRVNGKAVSSFKIFSCFENYQPIVTWRVLGYLAEGEY